MISNQIQQGWQCPKCDRIYSPNSGMCFYCMPKPRNPVDFDSELQRACREYMTKSNSERFK